MLERTEGWQDLLVNEVTGLDEGVYGGDVEKLSGHALPKDWDNNKLALHFHLVRFDAASKRESREYCAYFQSPSIGLHRDNLSRIERGKSHSLHAYSNKRDLTMLVPIIKGVKYRKVLGIRLLPAVVWLERVDQGNCVTRQFLEPVVPSLEEVLSTATDWECNPLLFLAGKWLNRASKGNVIQSGSQVMGRVSNRESKFNWWLDEGGEFYDVPAVSVSLFPQSVEVSLNGSVGDSLCIGNVEFGPPELLIGGRQVKHEL